MAIGVWHSAEWITRSFPWLTADKMPDLLLFSPRRMNNLKAGDLPSHVRTPDGREMDVFGEDLATEGRQPLRGTSADDAPETRHL